MANLNETLIPSKGDHQHRELHYSGPLMLPRRTLLDIQVRLSLPLLLYLLKLPYDLQPLFGVKL